MPTTNLSLTWDDAWPLVEAKVHRVLRCRGAPPSAIDDGLQTAAERALMRTEAFDSLRGWINWTIKVAWHEVQNQWRRDARSVLSDSIDILGGPDPAAIVEHQHQLAAAISGLNDLTPAERRAVLSSLEDEPSEPLVARDKMRRYRARRHLAATIVSWDNDRP